MTMDIWEKGLETIRRMKENRTRQGRPPEYPDEEARKAAEREYRRQWRQDNPEKVKEWNRMQTERRRQNEDIAKRYKERSLECYTRNKDRYNANRRVKSDKDTPQSDGA